MVSKEELLVDSSFFQAEGRALLLLQLSGFVLIYVVEEGCSAVKEEIDFIVS